MVEMLRNFFPKCERHTHVFVNVHYNKNIHANMDTTGLSIFINLNNKRCIPRQCFHHDFEPIVGSQQLCCERFATSRSPASDVVEDDEDEVPELICVESDEEEVPALIFSEADERVPELFFKEGKETEDRTTVNFDLQE